MDRPDPRSNRAPLHAVALAYAQGDVAPRVVAKGSALLAEEILRRARESGVAIHTSRELLSLLMRVDLGRHVPPELYRAVAELLAWIYLVERRDPDRAGVARAGA